MFILRGLQTIFLLPGTLALGMLNIDISEDGGIFRSLINMIFWGILSAGVVLPILLRS